MERWRRAVMTTAVVVGSVLSTGASGADPISPSDVFDFRVQVGATPPPAGAALPFAYTRYYPDRLRVHRGQTVMFETVERVDLHTVSFWSGSAPPVWRLNEDPERFAVNEPIWQRSACGGDDQVVCRLDGSGQYLSSGLPVLFGNSWRVAVDLPEGTAIQYLCMVHPGMEGRIEVVADSVVLATQAELDAQTRAQVAADTDEAIEHRRLRDGQVEPRSEGGRTVWGPVLIGDSTPSRHVSIMAYMPAGLDQVRPGDAVEFVSAGMGHHSVTFPTELVGQKGAGPETRLSFAAIHPACDFDDIGSGAPGIPGAWAPLSPLGCPARFELVLSPWLASSTRAPGDLVATPATYHDSGLMWSEQAPDGARTRPDGSGKFPHSFVAEFPLAGAFQFACTVHGTENMAGSIQVVFDPAG